MSVTINVRETGNVTILEVAGRLTLGTSGPSLQDTPRDLLHSQHKNVIPDLSPVTCLDRSRLGQLVASSATVASGSGEIRLVHLTDSDIRRDGAHKRLHRFFDLDQHGTFGSHDRLEILSSTVLVRGRKRGHLLAHLRAGLDAQRVKCGNRQGQQAQPLQQFAAPSHISS
jgi:anti-anti-sigma regulatory factor